MKIIELLIDKLEEFTGFDAVALVEEPAIEADFYAFNNNEVLDAITFQTIKLAMKEKFVTPLPGESKDDYVSRCIPVLKSEGYDEDQAAAICYDSFKLQDETEDVYELIIGDYQTRHYDICPGASSLYKKIESGEVEADMGLAIRAAKLQDALFWLEKHTVKEMQSATFDDVQAATVLADEILLLARMMGLEEEHSYIPGHVQAIIDVARQSMDVDVSALPNYTNPLDEKDYEFESFTDYPESAVNAAKRALKWKDEHPDNDCGTRVGWARANQLANRRPISEDTIARMASFARHAQHKDVPYSEGCGGLMWDAWGGTAGIEWASNKLEKIRASKVSLSSEDIVDNLPIEEQEKILETLSLRGINEAKLSKEGYERVEAEEFFKHVFTSAVTGLPIKADAKQADSITTKGAKVLYEYVGPYDEKTRKFCRRMLQLSKRGTLWSKSDLQNIQGSNPEFPQYYNIFLYKGSYGCRHKWNTVYLYQKQPKKQKVTVEFMEKANNATKKYSFGINEDKMKVVGPLLIPNKLILRVDQEGNPYYVFFSEETVRMIAEKMMKNKLLDRVNLEHNAEDVVDGHMVQTWFVDDPEHDKSNLYGMKLPKGTWMGEYKIEDPKVWQMVKEGKVKGFSIEGFFDNKLIQASK